MQVFKQTLKTPRKTPLIFFGIAILIVAIAVTIRMFSDDDIDHIPRGFKYLPGLLILVNGGVSFLFVGRFIPKYSLSIYLTHYTIRAHCEGLYDLTLHKNDVSQILLRRDGDLFVKGESGTGITIPHYFNGYEDIKTHLEEWQTITSTEETTRSFVLKQLWNKQNIAGLIHASAFFANILTNQFAVILPATIIMICATVFLLIQMQKFNNQQPIFKRTKWIYVFVLIISIVRCIAAATGNL